MLDGFSGATRVYFIIGHPIAQVKSPYGMTRLLEENGKDAIMVPIDILPADVPGFVELAGRMPNCDGICITVPHKFAVVPHCRDDVEDHRTARLGQCHAPQCRRLLAWRHVRRARPCRRHAEERGAARKASAPC
jgi:hypothetical protein